MASQAWKPSEQHQAFLQHMRKNRFTCTIGSGLKAAGASHNAFWKQWMRNASFREWWVAEQQVWFATNLHRVYSSILERATGAKGATGDMRAAEVFLKRFDTLYMPKTQRFEPKSSKLEPVSEQVRDEVAQILDSAFEEPPPTRPIGRPPNEPYGERKVE